MEVGNDKYSDGLLMPLNFTMTLACRGMCDESLRITMDLLKLIVGYITGCQLSHPTTKFLKRWSPASLRILASLCLKLYDFIV